MGFEAIGTKVSRVHPIGGSTVGTFAINAGFAPRNRNLDYAAMVSLRVKRFNMKGCTAASITHVLLPVHFNQPSALVPRLASCFDASPYGFAAGAAP